MFLGLNHFRIADEIRRRRSPIGSKPAERRIRLGVRCRQNRTKDEDGEENFSDLHGVGLDEFPSPVVSPAFCHLEIDKDYRLHLSSSKKVKRQHAERCAVYSE